MQWKRITIYAIALFLTAQAIGFLYGLSLNWWLGHSNDMPQMLENVRLARRITIAIMAFATYFAFLRRIPDRSMAHAVSLFILVEILNVILELSSTYPSIDVIDWPYSAAHFAVFSFALLTTHFVCRRRVGVQT